MATYYVSPLYGSDANNGLGPDASHATNKPWATISKSMHAGTPVVAGDTIWVAPGNYFLNTTLTPINTISSAGSPTAWRGDYSNAQGFKDGSGVRLAPAAVVVDATRGTASEDTAGVAFQTILFTTNDPNGMQFYNLALIGSNAINVDFNGSTDLLFEDCLLVSFGNGGAAVNASTTTAPTAGRNWTFRRCEIMATSGAAVSFSQTTTAAATANADLAILFEACIIHGGMSFALGTAAGNKAGGIYFDDCTIIRGTIATTASCVSVALADGDRLGIHLRRCLHSGFVNVGTSGHVWDDGYCRFMAQTPVNFTEAGTSVRRPFFSMLTMSHVKWGYPPDYVIRNLYAWGPGAVAAQYDSAATSTTQDFWGGGLARPYGAGPSIGAIERAEITRDTGSLIDGADSYKVAGKGDITFLVPVDAVATIITARCRQDASYGAGTKPQLLILAEPSLGVTAQTITGVAAVSTNETLTTASFTPTAAGVVTVVLRSQAATSGAAYFDTITRS